MSDNVPGARQYYETIQLIERLHRRFLDIVKLELEKRDVHDINNVQSMILYNIGDDRITVGELTVRGYYLGSNVSYNVKKMVENGYIAQEPSTHDRRSSRVSLTEKGRILRDALSGVFASHVERLSGTDLTAEKIQDIQKTLAVFERFWESRAHFSQGAL